jgi:hypothetical protein
MSWFRRGPRGAAAGWPYTPDRRDRVEPLADVPGCEPGAPLPVVLASGFRLLLAYVALEPLPANDGREIRIVGEDTDDLAIAVVEFHRPYAHLFGPPDDEAMIAHPLAGRGIHPCGAFTVRHSSWLRALERADAVHPRHAPARFRALTHYVLTFRDSTFECAANDVSSALHRGSLRAVVAEVSAALW